MHNIYSGELVRIRPFKDADEMVGLMREETSRPNEHWGPFFAPDCHFRRLFEVDGRLGSDQYCFFAIEKLDTGELVGWEDCGVYPLGSVAGSVGTFVREEHRRRGYGREAKLLAMCYLFENFPIETVWADTAQSHKVAWAGLEAVGMKLVGMKLKRHYRDGWMMGVPIFQIMRREWQELPIRSIVRRG